MKILKLIAASFSMYSKIPMPHIKNEEDMRGAVMFLPLTGYVIAALMFVSARLIAGSDAPVFVKAIVAMVIPLAVTGGFHVEGYMDTADALSSYRSAEKKLEILKDPHIGSFAVIRAGLCGLLMLAGLGMVMNHERLSDQPVFILSCGVFVISRALAGLTSFTMKKAREDGMLAQETAEYQNAGIIVLAVQLIAALSLMAYIDAVHTAVIIVAFAVFTVFYRFRIMKAFGGVTGDTAGYFVTASEVFTICALAVAVIFRIG